MVGFCGTDNELMQMGRKGLGCNGLYNSFLLGPKVTYDTMPFGFENHLIFGSINFRQDHMERAIEMLEVSRYDEIVGLIDKEEFNADPIAAYKTRFSARARPSKRRLFGTKTILT